MINLFEANNIHKQYAGHKALDGVSIQVGRKYLWITRPEWSWKNYLYPYHQSDYCSDSGNITFNGEPLQQKHIAQIGYLPEERGSIKR